MRDIVKWNKFTWKSVLFLVMIVIGILLLKLTSRKPGVYQNPVHPGHFGVGNFDAAIMFVVGLLLVTTPSAVNFTPINLAYKSKLLIRNIGWAFVGMAAFFFIINIRQ